MNPRPKEVFVTPFTINWRFYNNQFSQQDPELASVFLNVWDRSNKKRKWFGVGIKCTAEVFEAITGTFTTVSKEKRSDPKWSERDKPLTIQQKNKLLSENNTLKLKLEGAMRKAQDLNSFEICSTLKQFEKHFNQASTSFVYDVIDDKIKMLEDSFKWKTAESYQTLKNSLIIYNHVNGSKKREKEITLVEHIQDKETGKFTVDIPSIAFGEVDIKFLIDYENYLKRRGLSKNGISVYMRYLRHIYKLGIELGFAKESFYPFGRGVLKYKIKSETKPKEVLKKEHWIMLLKYKTPYPGRTRALDMFKLSYALNGANAYDMCTMLKEDLKESHIEFFRKKTDRKNKNVARVVDRNDFINTMLIKYSSDADSPYLLNLLNKSFKLDTKETRRQCQNINKRWDKQLKKVAKILELPKISPMWARHQRGTHLKEQELSLEEINLLYGHSSLKQTEAYIHNLPTTKKIKNLAQKLDSELM